MIRSWTTRLGTWWGWGAGGHKGADPVPRVPGQGEEHDLPLWSRHVSDVRVLSAPSVRSIFHKNLSLVLFHPFDITYFPQFFYSNNVKEIFEILVFKLCAIWNILSINLVQWTSTLKVLAGSWSDLSFKAYNLDKVSIMSGIYIWAGNRKQLTKCDPKV